MAAPTEPRYTARDHELSALFDALQQAQPLTDGAHAEQRHFLDADADTCVPLPGVPHPKPAPTTARHAAPGDTR
jgi:hypothetical protein